MRFGKMFFAPDTGAPAGGGTGGFDASVLTGEPATTPAAVVPAQDTTAPQTVATQTQQTTPAAVSLVDASGNLAQNWRDSLPENLRGEKTLENFKDIAGLASALVNTKKLVGVNSIKLPDQHSSEADWAAFYDKVGRPAKAEDYQFERDQRIPEALRDSKNVQEFRQTAHALGLSQKQVAGLIKMYDGQMANGLATAVQKADQERQTNLAALKTEWGDNYDANVNQAVMALNVLDPKQELSKSIPAGNPAFIKLLSKVATMIGGDAMVRQPGGGSQLTDIEAQMSAIQNNPAYRNPANPDQKRLIAQYSLLAGQRLALQQK